MPDYSKGKIYKIVDNTTGNVYIGHTTKTLLSQRLAKHNSDYNRWKNGKSGYITSFKILENGDYYIDLLEAVNCKSKDELKARERFYIENNKCVNKLFPGRTYEEYYAINREILLTKERQRYKLNIEKEHERSKADYQKHKEKRQIYRDAYKEKSKEKYNCECGGKYTRNSITKHNKTNLHQDFINLKNKEMCVEI